MKVVICWSMSFSKDFFEAKIFLEKKWHKVVIPDWSEEFLREEKPENKKDKIERNAIKNYFEEIKKSDAVLVLNKDKNWIKNYIWWNTLMKFDLHLYFGKKFF